MNNYKELKIWQKSVDLAVKVYELTQDFPKEEIYGLTSQIRRSGVSIPSNIAEGSGRNSSKEFNHFLGISHGSSYELDTQLTIASRIGFLKEEHFQTLQSEIDEIQKMNHGLKKSLKLP
ncbi:four helix bundle protein [Fulvivirga sp. M361]|uniref:four helix bundle protein n=1 Tax=Fulvivirga sp. M361 TaxID=2594266 RepID=UPI0011963CCD|nr:four helix bundle protein [Fulvivirga sp. M361]TRX49335.1 four helix bundle protein [Fulvivirga sp. M361]